MLSLAEARQLPPIASNYETTTVLRLEQRPGPKATSWELREVQLASPFRAANDEGDMDDWMESYTESVPIEDFHFVGAYRHEVNGGLLTWKEVRWNSTFWLVDIRVREEMRRGGVGSALVRWLQNAARSAGTRGITLETQPGNVPAIHFYRAHGFDIAGFNDRFYDNESDSPNSVALFLFWETRLTGS